VAVQLDRMGIEEAGRSSRALAVAIHLQVPVPSGAVPVEEIAAGLDIIEIQRQPLTSFEGVLLTQPERTNGMILVNSNAGIRRQRFTIAHELLHFLNDKHVKTDAGFHCTRKDISVVNTKHRPGMSRHLRQEAEANRFAIELLAPRYRFDAFLRDPPHLGAVVELARSLNVSKEATARRYIELSKEIIAVFFHHNDYLRYPVTVDGFPDLVLRGKDPMPWLPQNPDADFLTRWQTLDPDEWLTNPKGYTLRGQTLYQHDGCGMTMLRLDGRGPEGADDDAPDSFDHFTQWS